MLHENLENYHQKILKYVHLCPLALWGLLNTGSTVFLCFNHLWVLKYV